MRRLPPQRTLVRGSLVAALVANLVFAWMLMARDPSTSQFEGGFVTKTAPAWFVYRRESPGVSTTIGQALAWRWPAEREWTPPRQKDLVELGSMFRRPPPRADGHIAIERSAGWPWRVFAVCEDDRDRVNATPRLVPRIGLILNTVLLAPIFYGLWVANLQLRLQRRHERLCLLKRQRVFAHACPICRYDLRGSTSPGCPECGWGRPRREGRALRVEAGSGRPA